ncbi:SDR family NAD(P)-dependent oxidoreductase [Halomonas alkaliantarctica]|nr:SDR family NAD(P)-dependent oxidoreductase [Halomonas alkaliantarctica]
MLPHLPSHFTAVVTGASGGIGHAVVESLLNTSQLGKLIAVSRAPQTFSDSRVTPLTADVSQERGRQQLKEQLNGEPVHLLFNAIGILHDHDNALEPEKRLEELDSEAFAQVMHINAATPALLIAAVKDSLQGKHPTIIASLSARVGSIGDNGFGGWYSYRASKAAHNMLLKTASIELKRLNKQSIVLCLHPGTTDTDLSKPFQARVPEDKLFSPSFVAESLIGVMAQRTPEDTGSFWDWAGEPIEW